MGPIEPCKIHLNTEFFAPNFQNVQKKIKTVINEKHTLNFKITMNMNQKITHSSYII